MCLEIRCIETIPIEKTYNNKIQYCIIIVNFSFKSSYFYIHIFGPGICLAIYTLGVTHIFKWKHKEIYIRCISC
jgi:hypothetical protein